MDETLKYSRSYLNYLVFHFQGLTLATEDDADVVPGRPIYISALQENGLAERTKTIQVFKLFMRQVASKTIWSLY